MNTPTIKDLYEFAMAQPVGHGYVYTDTHGCLLAQFYRSRDPKVYRVTHDTVYHEGADGEADIGVENIPTELDWASMAASNTHPSAFTTFAQFVAHVEHRYPEEIK